MTVAAHEGKLFVLSASQPASLLVWFSEITGVSEYWRVPSGSTLYCHNGQSGPVWVSPQLTLPIL